MINVEKIKPTGIFTNYIYKAIPLAFDESMSYYECLCGLLSYLKDTVIPALNNNADAILEVQNLITELQNYVDNYFDNLDVQEEINNKLDEMAENGELADIIAQYLGLAGVLVFDTVADMKTAENLVNGSITKTLGYHSISDNGSAFYKVRTITNEDTVNEQNIIALHDNTLIAELVINDHLTPEMFGCFGDGTNDDTSNLQDVIDFSISNKILLKSRKDKKYIVSDTIVIDGVFEGDFENAEINGDFADSLIEIKVTDTQGYEQDKEIYYSFGGYLKNLIINGNETCTRGIDFIGQKKFTCENIEIINCVIGLYTHSITECVFDTIRFQKCSTGLYNVGSDAIFTNIFGRFCNIGINTTTYLEIINSHFWVRVDETEWTDSIYAITNAGIKLLNATIDSYKTGIKLEGTGSYPTILSGHWLTPDDNKEYTLFDTSATTYDTQGGGIRVFNFTAVGKTTSPYMKFININTDTFSGFIDYTTCRLMRIDNVPLTTHLKLINIAEELDVVHNRVDIEGYRIHVLLFAKVNTAFKYKTIAELPSNRLLDGIPLIGKAFLGVTSSQYSISNTQQILGGFVTRQKKITIATLDNVDIPVNTYITIEFDIVMQSAQSLNEGITE